MGKEQLYLSFYTFDETKQEIIKLSYIDNQPIKNRENKKWESLIPIIKKIAKANTISVHDNPRLEEPQIILLFLKSEHIANGTSFFDALANGGRKKETSKDRILRFLLRQRQKKKGLNDNRTEENGDAKFQLRLRPNVPPAERLKQQKPDRIYHPIITVCYTDITTLYSEDKEKDEELKWNELIYKTFQHDARVKFLDSSIWHRYVPVYPFGSTFEDVFQEVLSDVTEYHKRGLYYTNAANVTLEFQMRMLENSFIAKMGDGNARHSEVVTPFKFHSERQMYIKSKREIEFLNTNWEKGTLLENLKWRVLIVDDQATKNISPISQEYKEKCNITKELLIRKPLDDLYINYNNKLSKNQKPLDPQKMLDVDTPINPGDRDVLKFAKKQMKEVTYDIIFLDYLLGYKGTTEKREYGYEFIIELLQDNRHELSGGAFPQATEAFKGSIYKRDFLGKHWIFPISSFPHALSDKLIQMGISHLHETWHISQGGDPITTPHLYAYNLYRFLKQKIGKYFLYPNAMRRAFNEIPFDPNHKNKHWAKILKHVIENWEKKLILLEKFSFNKNTSVLAESMKYFIEDQIYLREKFGQIKTILELFEKKNTREDTEIIQILEALPKGVHKDYEKILRSFQEKVKYIVEHNLRLAKNEIANAKERGERQLHLSGFNLKEFPPEIETMDYLHKIDISENMLTQLPEWLSQFSRLREVDLSDNKFSELPTVLLQLGKLNHIDLRDNDIKNLPPGLGKVFNNLEYLDLSDNPIPLERKKAENKNQVKQLFEEIERINQITPKEKIKKDLNDIIAQGEIKQAIFKMREIARNTGMEDIETELTQISGNYNRNQKDFQSNLLSEENYGRTISKITYRLTDLISEVIKAY